MAVIDPREINIFAVDGDLHLAEVQADEILQIQTFESYGVHDRDAAVAADADCEPRAVRRQSQRSRPTAHIYALDLLERIQVHNGDGTARGEGHVGPFAIRRNRDAVWFKAELDRAYRRQPIVGTIEDDKVAAITCGYQQSSAVGSQSDASRLARNGDFGDNGSGLDANDGDAVRRFIGGD